MNQLMWIRQYFFLNKEENNFLVCSLNIWKEEEMSSNYKFL